jgi:hypothetical protein
MSVNDVELPVERVPLQLQFAPSMLDPLLLSMRARDHANIGPKEYYRQYRLAVKQVAGTSNAVLSEFCTIPSDILWQPTDSISVMFESISVTILGSNIAVIVLGFMWIIFAAVMTLIDSKQWIVSWPGFLTVSILRTLLALTVPLCIILTSSQINRFLLSALLRSFQFHYLALNALFYLCLSYYQVRSHAATAVTFLNLPDITDWLAVQYGLEYFENFVYIVAVLFLDSLPSRTEGARGKALLLFCMFVNMCFIYYKNTLVSTMKDRPLIPFLGINPNVARMHAYSNVAVWLASYAVVLIRQSHSRCVLIKSPVALMEFSENRENNVKRGQVSDQFQSLDEVNIDTSQPISANSDGPEHVVKPVSSILLQNAVVNAKDITLASRFTREFPLEPHDYQPLLPFQTLISPFVEHNLFRLIGFLIAFVAVIVLFALNWPSQWWHVWCLLPLVIIICAPAIALPDRLILWRLMSSSFEFWFLLAQLTSFVVCLNLQEASQLSIMDPTFRDTNLHIAYSVVRGVFFTVTIAASICLDAYPLARRAKLPILICSFVNLLRVWIQIQFLDVHQPWFTPVNITILFFHTDTQTVATSSLGSLLLFFCHYCVGLYADSHGCVILQASVDVHAASASQSSSAADTVVQSQL